ncbi:Protein regulator of cytokinesis 1 [Armadillidium nasatum]|uniref:Bleomycin hydrolase n=1 Tax=Armadillidium nasatum TaxID=96803 RepID=A0A5N5T223_9CRUS|nr:Protein regulator of cytokinesis 1 [Armadillidium nasatum]
MYEDKEELAITPDLIKTFSNEFKSDPVAQISMNACWKCDPIDICLKREKLYETNHVFTHKVESEGKPVTHQKSTGRCWIFASLNAMRIPFMKSLNIEEFEFSQAYLFFWDKIERCNYFLNKIVECIRKNEEIEGRLISYLLKEPTCDGGQWDMIVNLITKYGVMPKKCFLESYSAENSLRLNRILETKLREYTRDIYELLAEEDEGQASEVVSLLQKQMKEVFRIVSICLGIPPENFTWEYYDKSKNYHSVGPVSPLEFYEKHVCLVNDPRPKNEYSKTFTVDCLGNMVNGRVIIYNNQPIEVLMKYAAESIKSGEAVWFGCEVSKRFASKLGIQDIDVHDYKSVFGVDINMNLSKADRLIYGDSLMTHAMTFTAVTFDDNGLPVKWRVENSWGEDRGDKGYHVLTSVWFREFVFEIVVDKKHLPKEILDVFDIEPVILPAWDPMGALAKEANLR